MNKSMNEGSSYVYKGFMMMPLLECMDHICRNVLLSIEPSGMSCRFRSSMIVFGGLPRVPN